MILTSAFLGLAGLAFTGSVAGLYAVVYGTVGYGLIGLLANVAVVCVATLMRRTGSRRMDVVDRPRISKPPEVGVVSFA